VSTNVDVIDFEFTNDYSKINIRYKNRTAYRKELIKVKFSYFNIDDKTWIDYSELNQNLLEIEGSLIK